MHQCTHLWRRLCFVNDEVWPLKVSNLKPQRQILSNFHLRTTHNHFFKPYVTLRNGKLVHYTTSYIDDVQNMNTWVIFEYYNRWSNYFKSNYAFVWSCGKMSKNSWPSLYMHNHHLITTSWTIPLLNICCLLCSRVIVCSFSWLLPIWRQNIWKLWWTMAMDVNSSPLGIMVTISQATVSSEFFIN